MPRETVRIVSDLLEAVNDGQRPRQALCAQMSDALSASVAAYIRFDTSANLCTLTCWPADVDILRLKVAVERVPRAYPLLIARIVRDNVPSSVSRDVAAAAWHGSVPELLLWELIGCREVAQMPLAVSGSQLRVLAVARTHAFSSREMHLLHTAHRPLAALDRVLHPWDAAGSRVPRGQLAPPAVRAGSRSPDGLSLTPRETEVLEMLAEGLLARTIAIRMNVSTRTVHKHLGNVYRKLGTHDRLLAVNQAQAMGVIPAQRLVGDDG